MKAWSVPAIFLWLVCCATSASAGDLIHIDRSLSQEPEYESKPRYCLLVFGPEAESRAWLIFDGSVLYVDRNGNGDVTEDGERCELPGGETPIDADGKHRYKLLVSPPNGRQKVSCQVTVVGQYIQYAFLQPADKPHKAPVYHFHGPLQFGLVRPTGEYRQVLARGQQPSELRVVIGTPNPDNSDGWVWLSPAEGVPVRMHPVAEVEFPGRAEDGPPLHRRVALTDREPSGAAFFAPIPVPEQAGAGTAKVTLTFDDWDVARVNPTTLEVPLTDSDPYQEYIKRWSEKRPKPLNRPKTPLDSATLDRTIRREPEYRGEPTYCLLVFGPEAETRIWLVLDRDTLYIDRNGNGDLTEPGESIHDDDRTFAVGELREADGRTIHTNVRVNTAPSSLYEDRAYIEYIRLEIGGQYAQSTFVDTWEYGPGPQGCAVRYFNGPLEFRLNGSIALVPGKATELQAAVGTRQPTGRLAQVSHRKGIPPNIHPVAEMELPNKNPNVSPIRITIPLTQRC